MVAQPVDWILVIFYGPSAHRATYGRFSGTHYTKDFIQLSRKKDFIDSVTNVFPAAADGTDSFPLIYKWPTGTTTGEFVFFSADRPHLKWETNLGAPKAWKMSLEASEGSTETIPGDPKRVTADEAEEEFALIKSRGGGQPYLTAIKLHNEPNILHLRVYLANPSRDFAWADVQLMPDEIQTLIAKTSQQSALAWSAFYSGGIVPSKEVSIALAQLIGSENPAAIIRSMEPDTGIALASYLEEPAFGLFFDPSRNHDAWVQPVPLPEGTATSTDQLLEALKARFPTQAAGGDAAAETFEYSTDQVEAYRKQILTENFEVDDAYVTGKTRGSAQRAFSEAVKRIYGFTCSITGINTRSFLVASHIVPWSVDKSIRLDPSNGVCLSLIMDRAFENGYIKIEDDLTIVVDLEKVGSDNVLGNYLNKYHGKKLRPPLTHSPNPTYLKRRRELVTPES